MIELKIDRGCTTIIIDGFPTFHTCIKQMYDMNADYYKRVCTLLEGLMRGDGYEGPVCSVCGKRVDTRWYPKTQKYHYDKCCKNSRKNGIVYDSGVQVRFSPACFLSGEIHVEDNLIRSGGRGALAIDWVSKELFEFDQFRYAHHVQVEVLP